MILAALAGLVLAPRWELVVLGVAQDAGMPHLGCMKGACKEVHDGLRKPEKVACLGLIDRTTGTNYLFDATPDMSEQLYALNGGHPPDGVFLTHAHLGHYTGLMYFGRESIGAKKVPVWGTERMRKFLADNGPWSLLVTLGNIDLNPLVPDEGVALPGGVTVTPFLVPHRDEFTDTVGFRIDGPNRKAVFIPDIDQWERWNRSIRDLADKVDLLFVDGTFGEPAEIGRNLAEIPHPMVPHTRELLRGARAKLWFIHLNHTNAERDAPDAVKEGMRFEL
ncbi:MAG: MBL fold metallo-hydrolase [Fimbriimonadaceae bacterium]|nr:MBL fold metallo-hydrolase [Fimbriimonadaceae bacterium]